MIHPGYAEYVSMKPYDYFLAIDVDSHVHLLARDYIATYSRVHDRWIGDKLTIINFVTSLTIDQITDALDTEEPYCVPGRPPSHLFRRRHLT
jgi:hypothetical protein